MSVPVFGHQVQVHGLVLHLFFQTVDVASRVARKFTDFLHFRQAEDTKAAFDFRLEGNESRIDGPAHRRGDEQLDVLVVLKMFGEISALLFTVWCQVWVNNVVVRFVEVVIPLRLSVSAGWDVRSALGYGT